MKAEARDVLSTIYMEFGNLLLEFDCNEDSPRFLARALKMSEELNDVHGMRRALQSLGKVLSRKGNFKLAETLFRYCLELHEEDNPGYDLFPMIGLTELYRFMGRYEEAEKMTLELREKLDLNEALKPYVCGAIAGVYMDVGKYRECIAAIDEIFEAQEEETRGEIWIELHTRRAWCYFQLGMKEKATDCLNVALVLARDKDAPYRESSILSFLSMSELEYGDRDKALSHARLAVDKASSANSELCMVLAFQALGGALVKTGAFNDGMEYLQNSLHLSRTLQQQQDTATAMLSLSRSFVEAGDNEKAVAYAYRVLHHTDASLTPLRKEAFLVLSKAYINLGMEDEARILLKPVIEWSENAGVERINKEAGQLIEQIK